MLLLAAFVATVAADSLWFLLGRRYGQKLLKALCRVSLSPDTCVRQTEGIFEKYGLASLLFAKFVPGYSTVAPPLAGASGTGYPRFLLFTSGGTLLWAGSALFLGAAFHGAVDRVLAFLASLGGWAFVVLAGGLSPLHPLQVASEAALLPLPEDGAHPRRRPEDAHGRGRGARRRGRALDETRASAIRAGSPGRSRSTSRTSTRTSRCCPRTARSSSTARDPTKPRRPVWHASSWIAGSGSSARSRAGWTRGPRPASRSRSRARGFRSARRGRSGPSRDRRSGAHVRLVDDDVRVERAPHRARLRRVDELPVVLVAARRVDRQRQDELRDPAREARPSCASRPRT